MIKPTVLIVLESDGYLTAYGSAEVEVKIVEIWDPEIYDEGTVDEQVERQVPRLHSLLCEADNFKFKETGTPKPYGGGGKQTIWERLVDLVADAEEMGRKYNLDLNMLQKLEEIVSRTKR